MPEILTESFCERCGTRYTFESAAPRAAKLSGIKVLSRGLRNFVMSDDTSMDEAMAAARSETDREVTSQQLDAFHKTFNFCMTCRQYTCGNCWNEAEGRCLTCAPHLGHEILPAPFPDLPADGIAATNGATANGANGHAAAEPIEALAWPTMDLERDIEPEAVDAEPVEEIDAVARLAALGAVEAATDDETPAIDAIAAEPEAAEPEIAAAAEAVTEAPVVEAMAAEAPVDDVAAGTVEPTSDEVDVDPLAATAASATTQTNDLMQRFRPGQSLDAEIEAYEREQAEADAATTALAAAAAGAAIEPEPVVDPVAEDDDAAAAALLAAAAAARRLEPEPEPAPTPAAATPEPVVPARDVVEQPTWRIVAPDPEVAPPVAPAPDGAPATPPAAQAEPQWPAQPEWPSQQAAGGLPYLNRPAQPTGGMDALWAASASEVASQAANAARDAGGVQPCVSCGLSLSATARFCRRCGTRQG